MRTEPRSEPTIIEPLDLQAAAAALCCRFGDPSAEAQRLTTLHEVLSTSRALSQALDDFAKAAATHYRGIHCTSDMRGDAGRLIRSLTAWSESVTAAGSTYRSWQEGGDPLTAPLVRDEPGIVTSYPGLADVSAAPLNAPPA